MPENFKTAIIVDDAAIMRKRLEELLEKLGYKVIAKAQTGEEAYLAYKKHKPDFMTMDVTMPDMDGVEAVKKIKSDFPEAVIIMISALKYKSTVFEALKNGAEYYITKPISYDKVKKRIKQVENMHKEDKANKNRKMVTEIIEREEKIQNQLREENRNK